MAKLSPVKPLGKLAPQPWMTSPKTRALLAALMARGTEVRFVGGCVRDAVAKRPVVDIDIATPDRPETVIKLLQAADIKAIPTGIEHGTVTAVIGKAVYEITTLRIDVDTDGRRAKVAFTDDWIADAARRDFTINALSCTPNGDIFDPYRGLEDLGNGVVRFVGNARDRIEEDILRLLRYFRFLAAFSRMKPDKIALDACRMFAPKLATLSAERIWREFRRILLGPNPEDIITLLQSETILDYILPDTVPVGRLRMLNWLETTAIQIDTIKPNPIRRLAAILNQDNPNTGDVAARFKLSKQDSKRLHLIAAPTFVCSAELSDQKMKQLLYQHEPHIIRDVLLLTWAQELSLAENRGSTRTQAWLNQLTMIDESAAPLFPLAGQDLLDLGIPAGRRLGELLQSVEEWWLSEGCAATREDCLAKLDSLTD